MRRRMIHDSEVSGRRTTLVCRWRRLVCDNCGERFLEDHSEFEGRLATRVSSEAIAALLDR